MLRSLPRFIRIVFGLPVLAIMIWAQYTAFSGKRDVEAWRAAEQGDTGYDMAPIAAAIQPSTPAEPQHYIGAPSPSDAGEAGISVWVLLASGGAGLSVLAGSLALFSLVGASRAPEDDPVGR